MNCDAVYIYVERTSADYRSKVNCDDEDGIELLSCDIALLAF